MIRYLVCLLLLVATVAFSGSKASADVDSVDESFGTQKYCGRNLVNVLTIVCDGIYNNQMSKNGTALNKKELHMKIREFRAKRSVVSIFQRINSRPRRGAYDECCRKGCSLDEMIGYCGAS